MLNSECLFVIFREQILLAQYLLYMSYPEIITGNYILKGTNIMNKFINIFVFLFALSTPLAFAADGDAAKQADAAAKPATPTYKAKSPKLTRAQLDTLLAKPDQVLIIDLRRPDELTAIGGFPVYLSIQAKELEKSLAFIPKDRTIVTVSNHAGRGGAGADLLVSKGYKVAGAVGVQDYEAEGGTLIKLKAPEPKVADSDKPAAEVAH
jgi:rhodanese-related sulfurtransferase